jgi:hypothetical protein
MEDHRRQKTKSIEQKVQKRCGAIVHGEEIIFIIKPLKMFKKEVKCSVTFVILDSFQNLWRK